MLLIYRFLILSGANKYKSIMKRIINCFFLFLGIFLSAPSKAQNPITLFTPLSVFSGMPKLYEYSTPSGEKFSLELIEIFGYPCYEVYDIPKAFPEPSSITDGVKAINMEKDSCEFCFSVESNEDYCFFISSGLEEICTLYDSDGIPLSPFSNFQHLKTTEFLYIETSICEILNNKMVAEDKVRINVDELTAFDEEGLCYVCFIELDENENVLYSSSVLFPCFGGMGSCISKKASKDTSKLYIKIIKEGEFSTLFEKQRSLGFINL